MCRFSTQTFPITYSTQIAHLLKFEPNGCRSFKQQPHESFITSKATPNPPRAIHESGGIIGALIQTCLLALGQTMQIVAPHFSRPFSRRRASHLAPLIAAVLSLSLVTSAYGQYEAPASYYVAITNLSDANK